MCENQNLKNQLIAQTQSALEDYFWRVEDEKTGIFLNNVREDIFCEKYIEKAMPAKDALRNLFRKHPNWDENLQAIVVKRTMKKECDLDLLEDRLRLLLHPGIEKEAYNKYRRNRIVSFFIKKMRNQNEDCEWEIQSICDVTQNAYHKNKKLTRILNDFCHEIGIADETKGSEYQKLYAKIAEMMTEKQIEETIFVSIHPAHLLTMSNPKNDIRGETLTTCHSINSFENSYRGAGAGLGCDEVSFLVFTVSDPEKEETLNNRKTTRQHFAYKPENGVLLQSRLYNGKAKGSNARTERCDVYLSLVKEIIDEAEKNYISLQTFYPETEGYIENMTLLINAHKDYLGYKDWVYWDFGATISIRKDMLGIESITIGAPSICFRCGENVGCEPWDNPQFCGECWTDDEE